MRKTFLVGFVFAIALTTRQGVAEGQEKKAEQPKKDSLEALIADGMKNNPDIKVAEEKVRVALAKARLAEVEAEAERAKLKAKIAAAFAEVEAARTAEKEGLVRQVRADNLLKNKVISFEEHGAASLTVAKLRTERVFAEERLKILVGRSIGETGAPAKN
jgi:hypothetical protein